MNTGCATVGKVSCYSSLKPEISFKGPRVKSSACSPHNNLLPFVSHHERKISIWWLWITITWGIFYECSKDRQEEPDKHLVLVCWDSCSVVYCCTLQTVILISQSGKNEKFWSWIIILPLRWLSLFLDEIVINFFKKRCLPKHSPWAVGSPCLFPIPSPSACVLFSVVFQQE